MIRLRIILVLVLCILLLCLRPFYPGRHRRYRRKAAELYERLQVFSDEQPGKIIAYLRKVNPYVFEELLLVAFENKGCKVFRNRRYSGDGGIDGRVKKDGQMYYIQAKRYKRYVNAKHVRAFAELCERRHVKGFFVHTGKTGGESRRLVYHNRSIEIISGRKLLALLRKA